MNVSTYASKLFLDTYMAMSLKEAMNNEHGVLGTSTFAEEYVDTNLAVKELLPNGKPVECTLRRGADGRASGLLQRENHRIMIIIRQSWDWDQLTIIGTIFFMKLLYCLVGFIQIYCH